MDISNSLRSEMIDTMIDHDNDGGGLTFDEFNQKYNHRAGGGGREVTSESTATDLAHDLGLHGSERAQFVELVTSGLSAQEVFNHFDLNGSGRISGNDLKISQKGGNPPPLSNSGGGSHVSSGSSGNLEHSKTLTLKNDTGKEQTYVVSLVASHDDKDRGDDGMPTIKVDSKHKGKLEVEQVGTKDVSTTVALVRLKPGETIDVYLNTTGGHGSYVVGSVEGFYTSSHVKEKYDGSWGMSTSGGSMYVGAFGYDDGATSDSLNAAKRNGFMGTNVHGDANVLKISSSSSMNPDLTSNEGKGKGGNKAQIMFALNRM